MEDLVKFFFEIGTLNHIMRSHYMHVLQPTNSIAEHSYRVTLIAYLLTKELDLDSHKVLLMSLFHDLPETRTGDSNWLQKPYLDQNEEKALNAQLKLMGNASEEIKTILEEYKQRETLESKLVKDADIIEYLLSLKELAMTGNQEAQRRLESKNASNELLHTGIAKNLADVIRKSNPTDWTLDDLSKSFNKYKT